MGDVEGDNVADSIVTKTGRAPAPATEETAEITSLKPHGEDFEQKISFARSMVERRLRVMTPHEQVWPGRLHAAIRHTLLAPGKRFRPLLSVLIAEAFDYEGVAIYDVGAVAELIHAASLILDDLPCMDDAELRRNRPCTHVAFDEATAILAATALLNRSFGVLSALNDLTPEVRVELVSMLSSVVGSEGLIGGQMGDLQNTGKSASLSDVERVNALKTGALFDFAVEGAAVVCGIEGSARRALKDFSGELGLAFQLMDDVKDATMSSTDAAKDTGKDIGKATIVALMGCEQSKSRLIGHRDAAIDALARAGLGSNNALTTLLNMQFSFID